MAPSNALCIVQSEISLLSTALKCDVRFSRGYQDEVKNPIYKSFIQLKTILNSITALDELEPLVYLSPFLEVIRSEDITGPITGLALTAVDKFLSYGLLGLPDGNLGDLPSIGPRSLHAVAIAAEAIAESGTQARFVGTDRGSDEVVLMKVLQLLRTLLLVPAGSLVSDRVVREILQSCFRICFEPKLSELLRRTAELCLASIVQLFFSRLPSLLWVAQGRPKQSEDSGNMGLSTALSVRCSPVPCSAESESHVTSHPNSNGNNKAQCENATDSFGEITAQLKPKNEFSPAPKGGLTESSIHADSVSNNGESSASPSVLDAQLITESSSDTNTQLLTSHEESRANTPETDEVPQSPKDQHQHQPPLPYDLPAIHDLLHYLTSLLTPESHSDSVISVALGLITIALETGADAIANCPSLLRLVQGDLTKHLLLLLYTDRVWLFAATLRVCFLLFESMRKYLKLQLEVYLQRLAVISSPDNESTSYERREVALESIVRLFLVPGFATELYVNYDCDPYCSNLFEDITKMLAKNAYPVDRLKSTHLLALDALLTVLNMIGSRCVGVTGEKPAVTSARLQDCPLTEPGFNQSVVTNLDLATTVPMKRLDRHLSDCLRSPSREELNTAKAKKKVLILGSDQFNVKPKQGIAFLQQHGALHSPLDPQEMAQFLHENPRLDKRMIGEYLSDRNNEHVLAAYVRHFNFTGISISEALRLYLEKFRLPGEAPLIERLMTHFASHWYDSNDAPFANVDAAFTLAYAILMLNTDQHNPNSKKQNTPMTVGAFKKNLSGINGESDFDPALLEAIFVDIQKREIVMPSEQTGLVRENYLWKCLLRRSANVTFIHTETGELDADLFDLVWGPTVSALSFIFDKTLDPVILSRVVHGFIRSAAIAAHHGMCDVLDNLVISLCKFTTLLTTGENPSLLPVSIGRNAKSRLALRLVFALIASHADILRYGWHSLLDCLLQLFRADLLPAELTEAEDFLTQSHRVKLTINGCVPVVDRMSKKSARGGGQSQREGGVLSSFYQYFTSGSVWSDSVEEDEEPDEGFGSGNGSRDDVKCGTENNGERATADTFVLPMPVNRHTQSEPHQRIQEQLRADYWVHALRSAQLDEQRASRLASETVQQCEISQLIRDTKFLVDASLTEFIKALLRAIRGDTCAGTPPTLLPLEPNDEDVNLTQGQAVDLLTSGSPAISRGIRPADDNYSDANLSARTTKLRAIRRSITLPDTAGSYYPAFCSTGVAPSEDCRMFCLELLIRILLHNRDRVTSLWPLVQCYLADLLLAATGPTPLLERVIVGFLRLAIYLLRRYEMTGHIFACLHYILLTRGDQLLFSVDHNIDGNGSKPSPAFGTRRAHSVRSSPLSVSQLKSTTQMRNSVGLQVIAGLSQLLRDHAADLPDPVTDWQLIFNLLEVCGAGLRAQQSMLSFQRTRHPYHSSLHNISSTIEPQVGSTWSTDSSHLYRGYTSDSEAPLLTYHTQHSEPAPTAHEGVVDNAPGTLCHSPDHSDGAWVLVAVQSTDMSSTTRSGPLNIPSPDKQDSTSVVAECPSETQPPMPAPSDCMSSAHQRIPMFKQQRSVLVPSRLLGLQITIGLRDAMTLKQAVGCLDFLVRDPAHITPDNFAYCVRALRVFVEACLLPAKLNMKHPSFENQYRPNPATAQPLSKRSPKRSVARQKITVTADGRLANGDTDSDSEESSPIGRRCPPSKHSVDVAISGTTSEVAVQLLDLISLLFRRATSIYTEWNCTSSSINVGQSSEENHSSLPVLDTERMWTVCWRPLLQATARLCCDCRREVRADALTHLQRGLLSSVLQPISGQQWQDCFEQILFPLLSGFLESIAMDEAATAANARADTHGNRSNTNSPTVVHFSNVEFADPRMRAVPLLTKVFLMHLRPLHELPDFHALWVRILTYMEQYMQASSSDSLTDAVRESLKNVLLVMFTGTHDTPPILKRDAPADSAEAVLWNVTANQLSSFLPALLDQLFPPPPQLCSPLPEATGSVVEVERSQNHEYLDDTKAETVLAIDQQCAICSVPPDGNIQALTEQLNTSYPVASAKCDSVPVFARTVVHDI